jgi:hypothetical protein
MVTIMYSAYYKPDTFHILPLGAFTKFAKSDNKVCPHACPSIHPHGTTQLPLEGFFMKFNIWVFFENLLRKLKLHYNMTSMIGTLHEDQYTFFIISSSSLLRMRIISHLSCRENWNAHFMFNNVRKSSHLMDSVEKYRRARQATNDNMAHSHCMLDT